LQLRVLYPFLQSEPSRRQAGKTDKSQDSKAAVTKEKNKRKSEILQSLAEVKRWGWAIGGRKPVGREIEDVDGKIGKEQPIVAYGRNGDRSTD